MEIKERIRRGKRIIEMKRQEVRVGQERNKIKKFYRKKRWRKHITNEKLGGRNLKFEKRIMRKTERYKEKNRKELILEIEYMILD